MMSHILTLEQLINQSTKHVIEHATTRCKMDRGDFTPSDCTEKYHKLNLRYDNLLKTLIMINKVANPEDASPTELKKEKKEKE